MHFVVVRLFYSLLRSPVKDICVWFCYKLATR